MADESFIVRLEFDARQPTQAAEALSRSMHAARTSIEGTEHATTQASKVYGTLERNSAKLAGSIDNTTKKSKDFEQSLSTTRYALYDVSNTLGATGLAMVGLTAATFAVGIAWEKNFSAVVRTSGVYQDGADAVNFMRNEFMELGQTLPVTTKELAEIGALGGQLGIEGAVGIARFTEVVAKLTATTDLSAEAAGTALGRFSALFEDIDPSNFENLASSILKVGVNSVATETQIVNIGTQISSMGAFAGLTAEQVVGLSGALASVGAQPELSRGTITRVFTLMSRAVQNGGTALDEFARVSGMSADQFRNSWGTSEFASTFQGFLKGIVTEGDKSVETLKSLGVSSVRDVPLLLRLAGAGDVVAKSFKNSQTGFEENTELADQYGVIAETTAAKLQILANNFEILLVAMADGGTIFGGLIDNLTTMLRFLTDIAQNPVGGTIAQIVLVCWALSGVLMIVGSSAARTLASIAALNQAMRGLGIQIPITGGAAATFSGMLQAVGLSAGRAATATKILSGAMKGLFVGAVIAGAVGLGSALTDLFEQMSGRDTSFSGLAKGLGEVRTEMQTLSQGTGGQTTTQLVKMGAEIDKFVERGKGWAAPLNQGFGQFFNDLNIYSTQGEKDFARLDRAMATTAESGDLDTLNSQLVTLGKETGLSLNEMIDTFPRLRAAVEASGIKITEGADGLYKFRDASGAAVEGLGAIEAAEEKAAAAAELFAVSIGFASGEALTAFQESLSGSSGQFIQFGDLIQRVQDKTRAWAEQESKDKYGSKDSWQEWYDGSKVNIHDFMTVLDEQIAAQGVWAGNMSELTARGATAFVTELARMGPEGAPLAAAAVNMTQDELMELQDKAYLAAFLASDAFAQGFVDQTPFLMDTYRAGGLDAVREMIAALRTGEAEVEAVVQKYGVSATNNPINIPVKTTGLETVRSNLNGLLTLVQQFNRTALSTPAPPRSKDGYIGPGRANGGYIRGPGTGTSDSIPTMLSNGEYVVRASAVRALGLGYLNAVNQGRRPIHRASGGPVGNAGGGSAVGVGIMELGPKSLGRMGGQPPVVNVYLDDVAIARAASRGNATLRLNGN